MDEALQLLQRFGNQAKLIAGGTDLMIQLRDRKISPAVLIDISSISETGAIRLADQFVEIGGTATFTEIEKNAIFGGSMTALAMAARSVGSPQIRNRATAGGNICNASPAADMIPPLLALDAVLILKSSNRTRVVPLDAFITGNGQTQIQPDEMLVKIRFRKMPALSGLGFSKLGIRNALAIARLSMSVMVVMDSENRCRDIRIASGALGVRAQREKEMEAYMQGKMIDASVTDHSASLLEEITVKRLTGRSTLPFKRHAVQGVFREALGQALGNKTGG
jgi:CO/xanthine dehydrogenase FAD-binding subunit